MDTKNLNVLCSFTSNYKGKRKRVIVSFISALSSVLCGKSVLSELSNIEYIKNRDYPWNKIILIHSEDVYEDIVIDGFNKIKYKYHTLHIKSLFEKIESFDQVGLNTLLNESLFLFLGLNCDLIKSQFKLHGIDISGGNVKKREYLSINQSKVAIACHFLKIDKFEIGCNFHNIDIKSKINMGITRKERLSNILKKRGGLYSNWNES